MNNLLFLFRNIHLRQMQRGPVALPRPRSRPSRQLQLNITKLTNLQKIYTQQPTVEMSEKVKGNADPQIKQAILANIQAIGLENFPEDEKSVWNVEKIEQTTNGIFLVETAPVPDVGYARIRFHMKNTSVKGVFQCDHQSWQVDSDGEYVAGWTEIWGDDDEEA